MRHHRIAFVLALCLCASPAVAADRASGSVRHGSHEYRVVDAVAFARGEGGWELALSTHPFDRASFDQDGKLDFYDLRQPIRAHDATVLTLTLGGDGRIEGALSSTQWGGESTASTALESAMRWAQPPGERLQGSLDFDGDAGRFEVQFDVAVLGAPEVVAAAARKAAAAAAAPQVDPDTAAATAVFLAASKAVEDGDLKAFGTTVPPAMAEQLAALAESPMAASFAAQLREIIPIKVEVDGSERVSADEMQLRFRGVINGAPASGHAAMRRIGEQWRFEEAFRNP